MDMSFSGSVGVTGELCSSLNPCVKPSTRYFVIDLSYPIVSKCRFNAAGLMGVTGVDMLCCPVCLVCFRAPECWVVGRTLGAFMLIAAGADPWCENTSILLCVVLVAVAQWDPVE